MSRVIDYMDEIGLTSIENIKKYFHETEIDVLFTFDEYMQSLVSEDWEISLKNIGIYIIQSLFKECRILSKGERYEFW